MDVKVEIDKDKINDMVSKAILDSCIGKSVEEELVKMMNYHERNFQEPIKYTIEQEIKAVIKELIQKDFRDVLIETIQKHIDKNVVENIALWAMERLVKEVKTNDYY